MDIRATLPPHPEPPCGILLLGGEGAGAAEACRRLAGPGVRLAVQWSGSEQGELAALRSAAEAVHAGAAVLPLEEDLSGGADAGAILARLAARVRDTFARLDFVVVPVGGAFGGSAGDLERLGALADAAAAALGRNRPAGWFLVAGRGAAEAAMGECLETIRSRWRAQRVGARIAWLDLDRAEGAGE